MNTRMRARAGRRGQVERGGRIRYDDATEVIKGETWWRINDRKIPELQIRNADDTRIKRIFAHPEEKVVEEFARILSETVATTKKKIGG